MDIQAVSAELYGLAPQEFTAARDAWATEARKSGDRELAAAIKQLRRPNQAAWLSNLLARERPHRLDDLLALGDLLREAQRQLAGPELKDLARQGHRLIADMVGEAERLAVSAGLRPSPSGLRQLQETLGAALADADAGRQVRAGRLYGPLSYAGLGSLESDGSASPAEDRKRVAVERDSAALHAGEKRMAELTAELQSAQRRHDRVHEQVEELERQLGQVRTQESDALQSIQDLEAAIEAIRAEMDDARRTISGSDSYR